MKRILRGDPGSPRGGRQKGSESHWSRTLESAHAKSRSGLLNRERLAIALGDLEGGPEVFPDEPLDLDFGHQAAAKSP
jgi:hypothetical protein